MADLINNPPLTGLEQSMAAWVTQVFRICFANQQSGTTANRPTKNVWLGRRYYDTTLNKPIYISALVPIAWRDSAGVLS